MALDLADKTSNGNTLTNNGAAEWTTDFPFAASTEAVALVRSENDYLSAADSASLSITGNLTIESWVKFDTLPSTGTGYIVAAKLANDATQRSYQFLFYNNAGTYSLFFYVSTNGTSWTTSGNVAWSPSPTTNTWYHVAISYTNSTGVAKAVVDGTQMGADITGLDTTSLADTTGIFKIGLDNTTDVNYMNGKMDEVRVWNTARTVTEINDNKSLELTGTETGLQAYWPFEALPVTGGAKSMPFMIY